MKKRILLIVLAVALALCCLFMASCSCEFNPGENTESGDESGSESGSKGSTPSAGSADIENLHYLRVYELGSDSITVKFNVYTSGLSYDIRYSEEKITEENFFDATKADASISGTDEITAVINGISASLSESYYIAARSYVGTSYGDIETVRAGGDDPIIIDYDNSITNVYHGESLSSFAKLFDEQDQLSNRFYFPDTNLGVLYSADDEENQQEDKVGMTLSPIINLEYAHYVSKVRLFYGATTGNVTVRWASDEVDFQAANSEWDGFVEILAEDIDDKAWNEIIVGETTRYVQVVFKDGEAPNEIAIYGYQCGEGDAISTTLHPLPTMGEMMGMCGFVAGGKGNTPIQDINCTTVLREYHNFGWSYTEAAYPGMASLFYGTMGDFTSGYKSYSSAGILVIPCVQWADNIGRKVDGNTGLPIKDGSSFVEASYWEKFDPNVYFLYADNMFSFAARYGSTNTPELLTIMRKHSSTPASSAGAGTIQWLEFGNEPNGEDSRGMVPYQLAALQSAAYDGHEKTMVSSVSASSGYHLGAVNADPNMKVAMAGLAGTGGRYITSMCYWLKANRSDDSIAMDAFNFHCYFSRTYYMNNQTVQVGVSPEYYGIVDAVSAVIEFRNKYYPEKECWITEFGWDTNPSYETMTAAHAYGEYDSHEVQAMWLTRAYLLFSSCGIDKATMYMCHDLGYDATSVGKYGTCGVIGYDENGDQYKKDSYYYLYTLKNTLGDYTFNRELNSGRDDVWVYEYKNDAGKTAYAVWCPTQDGTKVEDFNLTINGSSATLVQAVDLDTDGISTDLTVSNGSVKINVSENPVYVLVD